jgi:hypothetical protein
MTAEQLAHTILALRGSTSCREALDDLLHVSIRYSRLRTDWALLDREGRRALDSARSSAHEVLLDACNILSRAMVRSGEDNQWRSDLGTERGFIGDVACHIHCTLGLSAR